MRGPRILIVLGSVAALVAAFALLRPEDEAAPPATTATRPAVAKTATEPRGARIVVSVRAGRPAGGIARATARQGGSVLVIVRSDAADHVHVHGYDLTADVAPGRPARMQFRAETTGRFEIELEQAHRPIAQLTVLP